MMRFVANVPSLQLTQGAPEGRTRLDLFQGETELLSTSLRRAAKDSPDLIDGTGVVFAGQPLGSGGGKLPSFFVPQLFQVHPDYDIARTDDGTLMVATERFRGGSNALLVGLVRGETLAPSVLYQNRDDVRHPRFPRGPGASTAYVAAALNGDTVVLLPTTGNTEADDTPTIERCFRRIGSGSEGVVIAHEPLTAQSAITAFLLDAEASPGPWPFGRAPRRLRVVRSHQGLAAQPPLLFSGADVYSFDIDVQGNEALLVASTTAGPKFSQVDLSSGTLRELPGAGEWAAGTLLRNPSVRATTGIDGRPGFVVLFDEIASGRSLGYRGGTVNLDPAD